MAGEGNAISGLTQKEIDAGVKPGSQATQGQVQFLEDTIDKPKSAKKVNRNKKDPTAKADKRDRSKREPTDHKKDKERKSKIKTSKGQKEKDSKEADDTTAQSTAEQTDYPKEAVDEDTTKQPSGPLQNPDQERTKWQAPPPPQQPQQPQQPPPVANPGQTPGGTNPNPKGKKGDIVPYATDARLITPTSKAQAGTWREPNADIVAQTQDPNVMRTVAKTVLGESTPNYLARAAVIATMINKIQINKTHPVFPGGGSLAKLASTKNEYEGWDPKRPVSDAQLAEIMQIAQDIASGAVQDPLSGGTNFRSSKYFNDKGIKGSNALRNALTDPNFIVVDGNAFFTDNQHVKDLRTYSSQFIKTQPATVTDGRTIRQ
jgi:hypothetical protein